MVPYVRSPIFFSELHFEKLEGDDLKHSNGFFLNPSLNIPKQDVFASKLKVFFILYETLHSDKFANTNIRQFWF